MSIHFGWGGGKPAKAAPAAAPAAPAPGDDFLANVVAANERATAASVKSAAQISKASEGERAALKSLNEATNAQMGMLNDVIADMKKDRAQLVVDNNKLKQLYSQLKASILTSEAANHAKDQQNQALLMAEQAKVLAVHTQLVAEQETNQKLVAAAAGAAAPEAAPEAASE